MIEEVSLSVHLSRSEDSQVACLKLQAADVDDYAISQPKNDQQGTAVEQEQLESNHHWYSLML